MPEFAALDIPDDGKLSHNISCFVSRPGHRAVFAQIFRLDLSARRLIWLDALLRWAGFAPKAKPIAAMLAQADSIRAGHNIASPEALAKAILVPDDIGEKARLMPLPDRQAASSSGSLPALPNLSRRLVQTLEEKIAPPRQRANTA